MSETARIADQLRRAFHGEAWHGDSLLEILDGVTAAQASARHVKHAHTIWELVLHIAAWDKAVTIRLGGSRGFVSTEDSFPKVDDTSEASWQNAIETLKRNHRELLAAMAGVEDSRLDAPVVEGMSTAYVHMHGAIQHDLYHAGQIALLKKA